ncbi:hypothetical protein [Stenotrophomonas geniculata]|uniref:Uncharacterized protein n=1 Tax=Stenotrophomonas geniculata N1 TaxID=1167641 RepID=A0A0L8AC07_9GAMM|nr:hypothetical protein [Stenotrophomonas geniculata]KOE99771.1 hypothetical protein W7K_08045 [Stenotrophomonas geniculata N1]MCF3474633.1 hypothetical protein [Stenotrophomonas maltophilia]
MTGRTQGPWAYQEQNDAYTHIVRGPNNRFICQLSQDSSGESERTARLIAAAPELLDALVKAERMFREIGFIAAADKERPESLWNEISAVIADANGGRP